MSTPKQVEKTTDVSLESLAQRVKELEIENQRKENRIEELEDALENEVKQRSMAVARVKGELVDQVDDEIEQLHQKIVSEQKVRSQHDSKIERKVSILAEETETDLTDTDVAGEDKIKRLLTNGPEDVVDRVYQVHHRARDLLEHAGEIGNVQNDKFGRRIMFTSPVVKERLGMVRNEELSTTEVKRVFEKVEELAADSPRKATKDFSGETNKLVINLDEGEAEA